MSIHCSAHPTTATSYNRVAGSAAPCHRFFAASTSPAPAPSLSSLSGCSISVSVFIFCSVVVRSSAPLSFRSCIRGCLHLHIGLSPSGRFSSVSIYAPSFVVCVCLALRFSVISDPVVDCSATAIVLAGIQPLFCPSGPSGRSFSCSVWPSLPVSLSSFGLVQRSLSTL